MDIVKFVTEFDNKTTGQWAPDWWNWFLSEDPDNDQPVSNMRFLRGGIGHDHKFNDNRQTASIKRGTAIFFPVADAMFTFPHKDHKDQNGREFKIKSLDGKELQTEDHIRAAILKERTSCKIASISDTPNGDREDIIPDGCWHRAESSKFILKVPKNSKFKKILQPGLPETSGNKSEDNSDYFDALAGGYYILIESLSSGKLHIHFEARGESGFTNSGTYDITVT
jgi:hypothetical protein